jgi:murein DD-endopeptidase MepM/ murein hydrolase activator NlpD
MIWPIENINAPITSKFGNRTHPVTGVNKFHNGIDIGIPIGTNIYAPESGKVSGTLINDVGGKQLLITHDNGIRTGYAHLDYRFVTDGQRVRQGQVIAKSGNTGATTGAHLHFTMKDANGNFLDPSKYYFNQKGKRGNLAALLTGLGVVMALYGIYETTTKKKRGKKRKKNIFT